MFTLECFSPSFKIKKFFTLHDLLVLLLIVVLIVVHYVLNSGKKQRFSACKPAKALDFTYSLPAKCRLF